jgi:hypothetical protein
MFYPLVLLTVLPTWVVGMLLLLVARKVRAQQEAAALAPATRTRRQY